MQRQNRRRITSIASPFMRANLTPEPRIASLDMAPHLSTCMRTRCDALVALLPLPRRPPVGLTLDKLTRKSMPLTFTGRALTNGRFHLVVIGRPIGTLENKVWDKPTIRFPSCQPDMAVSSLQVTTTSASMKGHTPEPVAFAPATTILETV